MRSLKYVFICDIKELLHLFMAALCSMHFHFDFTYFHQSLFHLLISKVICKPYLVEQLMPFCNGLLIKTLYGFKICMYMYAKGCKNTVMTPLLNNFPGLNLKVMDLKGQ